MHNLYNIINSGRQQQRTTGGVGKKGGIHYEVLLGPVAAFAAATLPQFTSAGTAGCCPVNKFSCALL